MQDIKIEFNNGKYIEEIVGLSKSFQDEQCCNGVICDDAKFFCDKKVAVALCNEKVIGYCYGQSEIKNKDTSFYKSGQKVFYLEEIFVAKNFRNRKIGSLLFNFILNEAQKENCDYIETNAVSKDYKKLLSFYINKMDMDFWSARLIKKID